MPIYSYYCESCDAVTDEIHRYDERPPTVSCSLCSKDAEYRVSSPGHFRISVEGNGRKGYKTDMGNGRKVVRSETRERYEHRLGNTPDAEIKKNPNALTESAYTKRYAEKVKVETKEKNDKAMRQFKQIMKGE